MSRSEMNLSDRDRAYLAGFIDGDGCISISEYQSPRTPTPIFTLQLVLSGCDKSVLDFWRIKTGLGHIKSQPNRNEHWRTSYQWAMSSVQAEQLLKEVYPYLMLKREQADLALEFRKTFKSSGGYGGRGRKVSDEVIYQRRGYKEALTRLKNYKVKRGPKNS